MCLFQKHVKKFIKINSAEELRQQLIKIIGNYQSNYPNELIPVVSDLCNMIAKLLTDPCPEVKIKLSELLINLSSKLNKVIGPHTKGIIQSLCNNLKHQHNKIRKITVIVIYLFKFISSH